jgi:hypothetical protein
VRIVLSAELGYLGLYPETAQLGRPRAPITGDLDTLTRRSGSGSTKCSITLHSRSDHDPGALVGALRQNVTGDAADRVWPVPGRS